MSIQALGVWPHFMSTRPWEAVLGARTTAVCFSGYHAVNVYARGLNLRKQLVEPLDADVHMALTFRVEENCSSADGWCGIHERLSGLMPAANISMEVMPSTRLLARTMEELPHWNDVILSFNNSRRTCFRNPTWRYETAPDNSSPYLCIHLHNTQYNTIFAPVIGKSTLNVLRQAHAMSRCLGMFAAAETVRGVQYTRVLHTRMEFIWLRPHPPLSLLDSTCMWVPDSQDWGGLNDRHAVLNREHAEFYMARWDMIIDGRVMQNNPDLQARKCCGTISDERWLLGLTQYHRIPVCRFPATAFLGCCNAATWNNCFKKICSRHTFQNMTLHSKTADEFSTSAQNAQALTPKARYTTVGELNISLPKHISLPKQQHRVNAATSHSSSTDHPLQERAMWIPGYAEDMAVRVAESLASEDANSLAANTHTKHVLTDVPKYSLRSQHNSSSSVKVTGRGVH